MNNDKSSNAAPGNSLLVGMGQSSRLREMRERTLASQQAAPLAQPATPASASEESKLSPELLLARGLIDQRLAEILASLPEGKQQRLFKIRFGVELNQLKELPIKRVVGLLKITDPRLNNLAPSMKRIGDLNYNGRHTD